MYFIDQIYWVGFYYVLTRKDLKAKKNFTCHTTFNTTGSILLLIQREELEKNLPVLFGSILSVVRCWPLVHIHGNLVKIFIRCRDNVLWCRPRGPQFSRIMGRGRTRASQHLVPWQYPPVVGTKPKFSKGKKCVCTVGQVWVFCGDAEESFEGLAKNSPRNVQRNVRKIVGHREKVIAAPAQAVQKGVRLQRVEKVHF